jgi:hypothetical protein
MGGLAEDVGDAASVLLQAPSMGGGRDHCTELLTEGIDPAGILFVTYTRDASACLDQLDGLSGVRLGVITVGDGPSPEVTDAETRSVSSASDLTGLGIEIDDVIESWAAPVTVCFDSLTSMLQYVEFETAYEFLHATTGRFYAADARAHYHIDPAAHDQAHVAGITSLMDAVVTLEDGEPAVRTRELMA